VSHDGITTMRLKSLENIYSVNHFALKIQFQLKNQISLLLPIESVVLVADEYDNRTFDRPCQFERL
jgi:hypothetical protein